MQGRKDVGWRAHLLNGALVGLAAALAGSLTLLAVGAASGRGLDILTDVGGGPWPSAVHAVAGTSPATSYLISHTTLYLLAGIVALFVASVADRVPVVLTGLLLVVLGIELAYLVVMTAWQAIGRFDPTTWRAIVIAHAVADLVLLLGAIRAHPTIRQAWRRAYQD